MKFLYLLIAAFLLINTSFAQKKKVNTEKNTSQNTSINSSEIQWISIEKVQEKMKTNPKKVYIDMYTSWCSWCKYMEKKTFTNKDVIRYLNEHFYCVRFDAERKDSVSYLGNKYGYDIKYKANELAVALMNGQMSYPTSVFMEENFKGPQPVPGYLDIKNMEMVLIYIGENYFKKKQFEDFQKDFKTSWK
jgi:thioredoxin-related protein